MNIFYPIKETLAIAVRASHMDGKMLCKTILIVGEQNTYIVL